MTKLQNPHTCACGDTFKSWYLLDKHIKNSPVEICQQRKKRGFAAKPNATTIHREQKLRMYHEKYKLEKYNSAEEVEKRRLREEDKMWKQAEKLHKKLLAEQEKEE